MFSFEGTPLENSALGWKLITGTEFLSALSFAGDMVTVPGRDEAIPSPPTLNPPVFPVVIYAPKSGVEALLAMWGAGVGYIADDISGRRIRVDVVSATPVSGGAAGKHVKVTAILRCNGIFWRDTDETTTAALPLAAASVVVPVFGGLSAPVRDAIIRVSGQANGLQLNGGKGSFVRYTLDLPASSWFRFECDSGRAFTTTTDTWGGGTEVTGALVNGPGPYALQITPKFINPAVRVGDLTVETTSRTGALIQVKGRRAYVAV